MASVHADVDFLNLIQFKPQLIQQGISQGLDSVGKMIVDLASQLAPEDTGQLKDSGDYEVSSDVLLVSFGNGLEDDRATAQELGTLYMPAQPYLVPAARQINVAQEIADVIIQVIR